MKTKDKLLWGIGFGTGLPLLIIMNIAREFNNLAVNESLANGGKEVLITMTKFVGTMLAAGMIDQAMDVWQKVQSFLS